MEKYEAIKILLQVKCESERLTLSKVQIFREDKNDWNSHILKNENFHQTFLQRHSI